MSTIIPITHAGRAQIVCLDRDDYGGESVRGPEYYVRLVMSPTELNRESFRLPFLGYPALPHDPLGQRIVSGRLPLI